MSSTIAHQQIDWSGIRANAVHMGIRAAARQAAANLPPTEQKRFVDRVMQRAYREGWEAERKAALALAMSKPANDSHAKPLSAPVSNGSEIAVNALADDEKEVRSSLSRAIRKTATTMQKLPGKALFAGADKTKAIVGAASTLYRWDQDKGGGISIQILNSNGAMG